MFTQYMHIYMYVCILLMMIYVNVEELWTTTFSCADAKVCYWN